MRLLIILDTVRQNAIQHVATGFRTSQFSVSVHKANFSRNLLLILEVKDSLLI